MVNSVAPSPPLWQGPPSFGQSAGEGEIELYLPFAQAADELAAAAAEFAQRGWVPATSGNFSHRLDGNSMLVTASGADKGALRREHFLTIGLHEAPPKGSSAETGLHQALYRDRPEIGAVLHVHSPAATLLSALCQDAGEIVLQGWEMQKALAGITSHESRVSLPVFPNDQDIPALAQRVSARIAVVAPLHGYLLAGHGLYAWGRDVAEAKRHVVALDYLFSLELEKRRIAA